LLFKISFSIFKAIIIPIIFILYHFISCKSFLTIYALSSTSYIVTRRQSTVYHSSVIAFTIYTVHLINLHQFLVFIYIAYYFNDFMSTKLFMLIFVTYYILTIFILDNSHYYH